MTELKSTGGADSKVFACSDGRLEDAMQMARDLKHLNGELKGLVDVKVSALLGTVVESVCDKASENVQQKCWIDGLLSELSDATRACRETLERMSGV